MPLKLALLIAVSFLPFPTKLPAEAIHEADAGQAAVIFYGATLLVISLVLSTLWGQSRATASCHPNLRAWRARD